MRTCIALKLNVMVKWQENIQNDANTKHNAINLNIKTI